MEPISQQEKTEMRVILSKLYGSQVNGWNITVKTFEVFETVIMNTKGCDDGMDLVPRPYGGGSASKWAFKQARQALLRQFKDKKGQHYIICMKAVALKYRSPMQLSTYN